MADQAPVLGRVAGTDTPAPPIERADDAAPPPADGRFVFPAAVRYAVIAYAVFGVPLVAAALWPPLPAHQYLRAMFGLHLAMLGPGALLAAVAAVRAPAKDRVVRVLWAGTIGVGLVVVANAFARIGPDSPPPSMVRALTPVLVALGLLLVANTLMLRARSGQRAALVDAVDLVMATVAVSVPFALAFGNTILDSPVPWFSVTAAMWAVLACHGTLVALVIRTLVAPGHRLVADLGIAFGTAVILSSTAQVVLGVHDFELPAGPFLAAHAVALAAALIFFAFTTKDSSPGLERLPVGGQVRRSSVIAMVVLASIPLTAAIAWSQRDISWVPATALVAGLGLLALSSVRHLLAAREALRLHELVEHSAAQRGQLLSEVMAHIDLDRHRAATHLHRQAASLHTAMASFTSAVAHTAEADTPGAVSFAVERLRRDLGQRADGFRRIAEAIKPLEPGHAEARRLSVPMRAYLENLCGDGPRPDLQVDIDPELSLDWTTEAVVLRIAQEATLDALWTAGATAVHIAVTADHEAIHLDITDNGCRSDPSAPILTTMRSLAVFMGGGLTTVDEPTAGRVVSAVIPFTMRAVEEPRVPSLRLVDDT
ncbi:MAG: sensor histidine kinase [Acidimicrobiales bacterium]